MVQIEVELRQVIKETSGGSRSLQLELLYSTQSDGRWKGHAWRAISPGEGGEGGVRALPDCPDLPLARQEGGRPPGRLPQAGTRSLRAAPPPRTWSRRRAGPHAQLCHGSVPACSRPG